MGEREEKAYEGCVEVAAAADAEDELVRLLVGEDSVVENDMLLQEKEKGGALEDGVSRV